MALFLCKRLAVLIFLALPLCLTHCTSSESEGDTSVLEAELENFDTEGDGMEDLGSMDEEFEGGDELAELDEEFADAEFGDDLSDDEFSDEGGGDAFSEAEFSDSEFDDEFSDDDFGNEEFAFSDEDLDSEFDDFDEFDNMEGGDEFAQNEKALAEEMQNQDYPMAEGAQPQFPEEVIGQNSENPPPGDPANPLPGQPVVTSETAEITLSEDASGPLLPQDDLGMADPIGPEDDEESADSQSWTPVVKIKTDPFFRNQRLMNAVYIARPEDSDMHAISQKLFNEDRSKELDADNPHLAKGIDPGDKIYYNSPNRPDDKTQLKFYYEDIGLTPQYYRTEKNDNIRRLGSRLLGFPDGWKEVWAINFNVDSKTILPPGLELKYWTGNESNPNLQMAAMETEEIADPTVGEADNEAEFGSMGSIEDPFNDAELPPEPPLPEAEIAMPEPSMNPEPVPDIEPFPEEGVEQTPGTSSAVVKPQASENTLLTVGVVALLVMAGVGLVAIQIKKRKDNTGVSPHSLEYTQV